MVRQVTTLTALLLVAMAACGSPSQTFPAQTFPSQTFPSRSPTITYDVGLCTYEGPDIFVVGERVRFTAVNESEYKDVGLQVWRFGTLVSPAEILYEIESSEPGFEYQFFVTFENPGRHGINCHDYLTGKPGENFVTTFIVFN